MMIARWEVDARFGHKEAALSLMRQWWREIAPQLGWSIDQVRIASGSLGVAESRIEVEVRLADLTALHDAWQRLATAAGQTDWANALTEHIVSGTTRWQVYRVEAWCFDSAGVDCLPYATSQNKVRASQQANNGVHTHTGPTLDDG